MNIIITNLRLLTIVILSAIFITSCGGGAKKNDDNYDKNVGLKPHETKIKGYLSEVFEVVDGSYKFDYKGSKYKGEGKIQVKVKSIGSGDLKDYGLQDGNGGPLYLTICDINGTPLTDFFDIESDYKSDDLLKDMMTKIGEENWISFHAYTYQGKRLDNEAATFIITSKKKEKSESTYNVNSSNFDDAGLDNSSSSGSENWDKILDDYEAYVDNYLKFLKKANQGDISAMSEYSNLMQKAQDLEKSLSKAQSESSLTTNQLTRMTKIQTKILNAAI